MITRINVAAAIINTMDEVLLTQRASNKRFLPNLWHLPGGRIEEGESPKEALRRELKEELSVDVVAMEDLHTEFTYPAAANCQHKTIFFLAKVTGEIRLNFENQNHQFVNCANLPAYLNEQSLHQSTAAVNRAIDIAHRKGLISLLNCQ